MQLHELKPGAGSTRARKRVGRGDGSGRGTFCGKGCKGQTARSGGKQIGFEGGQTGFLRRMPKLKGFNNINNISFEAINLADLEERYEVGETVDHVTLKKKGLLSRNTRPVKILGQGNLTKKLTVVCEAVSVSARTAIEKAGGEITITLKKKTSPEAK